MKLECFQARCLWPLAEWTRCSSGPEGTAAPCTTSFRSPSVYCYLSPSSPLPPALAALLPPAAPISQPRAWRSGWTPWRMPASPWLVFGASSYFFFLLLRQERTRVTNLSSLAIHNSREEECTHYKHFINKRAHGNKIKILRSRTPQRQKKRVVAAAAGTAPAAPSKIQMKNYISRIVTGTSNKNNTEPPLLPPPLPPLRIRMLLIRDSTSRAIVMDYCLCRLFFFPGRSTGLLALAREKNFAEPRRTVTMHNSAISSLE